MKKYVGLLFLCLLFSVCNGKKKQIMLITRNGKKRQKKQLSLERKKRVKSILQKFGVPFHVGMRNSCWYHPKLAEKNVMWQQAKNLYDTHIIDRVEHAKQVRIPKIIHQIWLGGPLPKKYYD